jgi:hypothetical protein
MQRLVYAEAMSRARLIPALRRLRPSRLELKIKRNDEEPCKSKLLHYPPNRSPLNPAFKTLTLSAQPKSPKALLGGCMIFKTLIYPRGRRTRF